MYAPQMRYRFYFKIRAFNCFFLKNWYDFWWGIDGILPKEKLWIIDFGAVTFGINKKIVRWLDNLSS